MDWAALVEGSRWAEAEVAQALALGRRGLVHVGAVNVRGRALGRF